MSAWKQAIPLLCCLECGKRATHKVFYCHNRISCDIFNEYQGAFCDECVKQAMDRIDAAMKKKELECSH